MLYLGYLKKMCQNYENAEELSYCNVTLIKPRFTLEVPVPVYSRSSGYDFCLFEPPQNCIHTETLNQELNLANFVLRFENNL